MRFRAALAALLSIVIAAGAAVAATPDEEQSQPVQVGIMAVAATTTTTAAPTTTTTAPTTTTTSTTTTAPPPPTTEAPAPPVTQTAPPPAGGSCGGWESAVAARWPAIQVSKACRILMCESNGNPQAQNVRSSASGLFQFLKSTWAGYGGYAEAWQAPASIQLDAALALWQRSGWGPWSCS